MKKPESQKRFALILGAILITVSTLIAMLLGWMSKLTFICDYPVFCN
ncbi:MAG: hypothetical protein IIC79_02300 [Chloroflexi bacterium]|nr:hypothetical protein [Chloroflexota bacterium]